MGQLVGLSLFAAPNAFATTFGPIPLVGQVEAGTYFVQGRIVGAAWVQEDRRTRRPATLWKLKLTSQLKGPPLPPEFNIRQPGGEMGEVGYHVAASARFAPGEEVFVNLEDTDEPETKNVIALTSGKYTVEPNPAGGQQVRTGLGPLLLDPAGKPFTPEALGALVRRVAEGKATEADRNVFVNKGISHAHDETPSPHSAGRVNPPASTPTQAPPVAGPPTSVQQTPLQTEEPATGSSAGWWIFGLGLSLAAMLAWFGRKH